MLKELYHQDFPLWLARTAECLRTQRYDHLDLENLIEEIESIAKPALRINESFSESPSLKSYFAEVFPECYANARRLASVATGLAIGNFPKQCPFAISEVLNPLASVED